MESYWQFIKWLKTIKRDANRDLAHCPIMGDACIGAEYMSYCEACEHARKAFRAKPKEDQK